MRLMGRNIAYATDGEEHCSFSSWRVSAEWRLAEWYGLLTMPCTPGTANQLQGPDVPPHEMCAPS